jgi:site-specific recombinase
MNMKPILIRNIALMVVFGAIGLTTFTENVRTVQIIGLFACGVVFGAAFTSIISAFKSKQTKA